MIFARKAPPVSAPRGKLIYEFVLRMAAMSPADTPGKCPLDETTIAAWVDTLVADEPEPIRAAFRDRGARGPEVIWNPQLDDLGHPQLRFLLEYWRGLAGERPMPLARHVDPLAMRPALGFVSLLDVIGDGADFRYRLFGTIPTAVTGFDMTRRLLSQHRASPYIVQYFIAVYRAMLRRREPVHTRHSAPATVMTSAWHRLALPLGDESGAITRILSANVPVGHDGKAINIGL
jgi:hypothetical protein